MVNYPFKDTAPYCCGQVAEWIVQTPRLQYWYCKICKKEPDHNGKQKEIDINKKDDTILRRPKFMGQAIHPAGSTLDLTDYDVTIDLWRTDTGQWISTDQLLNQGFTIQTALV